MKPIRLYQLDIDPATEQQLLSLTQRHLKLAVEHSRRETTPSRRAEIWQNIEAIRAHRDSLLASLTQKQDFSVAL